MFEKLTELLRLDEPGAHIFFSIGKYGTTEISPSFRAMFMALRKSARIRLIVAFSMGLTARCSLGLRSRIFFCSSPLFSSDTNLRSTGVVMLLTRMFLKYSSR